MSGHSKWATIKHKKGAADARRAKLFAKLIRQVEVAAREGGGDPDMNPTLRTMFQKARDSSVPLDTIERAIKRGTGELEGVTYEQITYEGYAAARRGRAHRGAHRQPQPHRLRRPQHLHRARRLHGRAGRGGLAVRAQGRDHRRPAPSTRTSSCCAPLDAGAEDIGDDGDAGGDHPATTCTRCAARSRRRRSPSSPADLTMVAAEPASPSSDRRRAKQVLDLIDALEDHDDVQDVYANFDIPDDMLEQLEGVGA